MIGLLQGNVIFSDGNEIILLTSAGVGYQVHFNKIVPEGKGISIFIAHIVKESDEELYGFSCLRAKKLFELLIRVKGVGPKSAFSLMKNLGVEKIYEAVSFENKKLLTCAPGIGNKAAAQIILDLNNKINKIKMYSKTYSQINKASNSNSTYQEGLEEQKSFNFDYTKVNSIERNSLGHEKNVDFAKISDEAIMACKELGFSESLILPIVQNLLSQHDITKSEQLVHLVLKEI
jgi:Holliday junction DNA helicase RuvA